MFKFDLNKEFSLFSIYTDDNVLEPTYVLHVFPKKEYRVWGKEELWYDGPYVQFGIGPLFLLIKRGEF
jgi:hypothetical protein